MMNRTLASPNRMIWNYFQALRLAVYRAQYAENDVLLKQEAATSVFLSITVIEAFLNVFFRVVVSEPAFQQYEAKIQHDLESNIPLKTKLEQWPHIVFKSGLSQDISEEFERLRVLRNKLTHFQSSHDSFRIDSTTSIIGLSDITVFESLDYDSAASALRIAEHIIEDIFRLRGINEYTLPGAMQSWTGKLDAL